LLFRRLLLRHGGEIKILAARYSIVIPGQRINLRTLREADALPIYENIRDNEVTKYLREIPSPYMLRDAYDFIKTSQVLLQRGLEFDFAIEYADPTLGQSVAGIIALAKIGNHGLKKEKTAEVGYWVGRKYWGNRIATDALSLITEYGFEELGLGAVYACVMRENLTSIHLLEKCGFSFDKELPKNTKKNGNWIDELRFVKRHTKG
jgi:RimJ/RimL family protein N-acetyltransferase